MPVIDGLRFYQQLESDHPALARRVLFVTAVAEAPTVADSLRRTGLQVLRKPYELGPLIEAVATLVDRLPAPEALL
jgi:CheY-like chemotaxis protein